MMLRQATPRLMALVHVAEKCEGNSVRFVYGPAARVNILVGGVDAKFSACADPPTEKLAVQIFKNLKIPVRDTGFDDGRCWG